MKRKVVDPIDRLPKIKFDEDKLVVWLLDQRHRMLGDREDWLGRQRKYLAQWDDYITYTRDGPWDNSSQLHLPLSMEKIKALHARFKKAIFATRPWWMLLPIEKMDVQRFQKIDTVMQWACEQYVNYYTGIEQVVGDWIWDTIANGWGVVKRRWEINQRNAVLVREITPEEKMQNMESISELESMMEKGEKEEGKVAREVKELVSYFDGPIIETVSHENILFPGSIQNVSNLNLPAMVSHDFRLDASSFRARVESGLYDDKNADAILKYKRQTNSPNDSNIAEYQRAQDDYQGVKVVDADFVVDHVDMSECFFRYDIDGDGIDEEMVATVAVDSRKLARLTYLDRITKTGLRPLHKADFIVRPRRAYSIGLLELLYPLQQEMDAIHNMRIDFGTLSNVPFFFFRSTSGMKGEKIKIEPGVGIPTDDPNGDVNFPRINSGTNFGYAEEASLDRWADRVTSINVMQSGLPTERVGATRTASGMMALMNEANTNLDEILDRFKSSYSGMLTGLLADLQERLPDETMIRVVGASGTPTIQDGQIVMDKVTRADIAGRVDFKIIANSASANRELEKQNSMQTLQMMLNPMFLQTGIVNSANLYTALRTVLEKQGNPYVDQLVTKPQQAMMPLSLYDEISSVTQGLLPRIELNDQHEAKVIGLRMWSQNPDFVKGIQLGVNAPNAMEILNLAIGVHTQMAEAIAAQAQMQNQTGLQISPSLGARVSGQVGETGRPLPEENVAKGQVPASEAGKEQAQAMPA